MSIEHSENTQSESEDMQRKIEWCQRENANRSDGRYFFVAALPGSPVLLGEPITDENQRPMDR